MTTDLLSYPEFLEARWNSPEGDLSVDQRHRARLWGTYRIPMGEAIGGIDLGVVQTLESGVPYGAVGAINTIPYSPAGLYLNPSGNRADGFWDYYFTGRDAFRTEANYRTDLALNYAYRLPGLSRVQLFFHGEVLNVFNVAQLCGCGGTVFSNGGATSLSRINLGVLTAANSPAMRPFNPFTEAPVEGRTGQGTDLRPAGESALMDHAEDVQVLGGGAILAPQGSGFRPQGWARLSLA